MQPQDQEEAAEEDSVEGMRERIKQIERAMPQLRTYGINNEELSTYLLDLRAYKSFLEKKKARLVAESKQFERDTPDDVWKRCQRYLADLKEFNEHPWRNQKELKRLRNKLEVLIDHPPLDLVDGGMPDSGSPNLGAAEHKSYGAGNYSQAASAKPTRSAATKMPQQSGAYQETILGGRRHSTSAPALKMTYEEFISLRRTKSINAGIDQSTAMKLIEYLPKRYQSAASFWGYAWMLSILGFVIAAFFTYGISLLGLIFISPAIFRANKK